MSTSSSKAANNRSALDSRMLELADHLGVVVINAIDKGVLTLDDLSEEAKRNVTDINDIVGSKDLSLLLRIILEAWEKAFEAMFAPHGVTYQLVDKARHVRNDFSHNLQDYSNDHYVADSLKAIDDLHAGIRRAAPTAPAARNAAGITPATGSTQNSAVSLYNQGMIHFERQNWDLAIANFTSAINIKQNYPEAWNRRGEAHFCKGEYDRAIYDYDRAIEIDPNCATYWLHRGWAYHYRGLYAPNRTYDSNRNIYVIDQNDAMACHKKGIADITNALNIDPNYYTAWHNRGWLFLNIRNYHQAIEDSSRALAIYARYPGTWNNRGQAHSRLKKWKEAHRDFDQALSIDPNYQVTIINKRAANRSRIRQTGGRFMVSVSIGAIILVIAMAVI